MKRFYWNILLVTSFFCLSPLLGARTEEIAHEADSLSNSSLADALHIGLSENTACAHSWIYPWKNKPMHIETRLHRFSLRRWLDLI